MTTPKQGDRQRAYVHAPRQTGRQEGPHAYRRISWQPTSSKADHIHTGPPAGSQAGHTHTGEKVGNVVGSRAVFSKISNINFEEIFYQLNFFLHLFFLKFLDKTMRFKFSRKNKEDFYVNI